MGRIAERFGISVALLTPFAEGGEIDVVTLGDHARRVVDGGADGVTLFGTTGEGPSIARRERKAGIEAVLASGVPSEKIVLGVCATATEDALDQVAEGRALGISQFLLLPPFYFKGCSDDGLFQWHMELIARTHVETRFILYHIPQLSGVALSLDLVGRLAAAAPARIRAIKDSSCSWENAEALLRQNAVPVLVGDERLLHKAAALGAAGSICGVPNLYPGRFARILETAREDTALIDEVSRIDSLPIIPALKAMLAEQRNDPVWERVRPPLTPLGSEDRAELLSSMKVMA